MQEQAIFVCSFLLVLGVVLLLARKNGSKAAQLEAMKAELKKRAEEQRRAQKIISNVSSLNNDDARRRLHDIATKQR